LIAENTKASVFIAKQIPYGNDRKKSEGNGEGNGKDQYGGPSLRFRMTAKNEQRQERLQVSPLRQTMRPFGSGRDDRFLSGDERASRELEYV
jgi:hypothetical protein